MRHTNSDGLFELGQKQTRAVRERARASLMQIEPFAYREDGTARFLGRVAFALGTLLAMALVMVTVSPKAVS